MLQQLLQPPEGPGDERIGGWHKIRQVQWYLQGLAYWLACGKSAGRGEMARQKFLETFLETLGKYNAYCVSLVG